MIMNNNVDNNVNNNVKERFLKLAEYLDQLADIAIGVEAKLKKDAELQKTASSHKLDPEHVLNFAKFFLAER